MRAAERVAGEVDRAPARERGGDLVDEHARERAVAVRLREVARRRAFALAVVAAVAVVGRGRRRGRRFGISARRRVARCSLRPSP